MKEDQEQKEASLVEMVGKEEADRITKAYREKENKKVADEEFAIQEAEATDFLNSEYFTLKWYIYVGLLVGAYFHWIVSIVWLWFAFKNYKQKDRKGFVEEAYSKEKDHWLWNNVGSRGDDLFVRKYTKEVIEFSDKDKVVKLGKIVLSIVIALTSLAFTTRIEEKKEDKDFLTLVKDNVSIGKQEDEQKPAVAKPKVAIVFPLKVQVYYPSGTRVFSDTTSNFKVLKRYRFEEDFVVDSVVGTYFMTTIEGGVGYVPMIHLKGYRQK